MKLSPAWLREFVDAKVDDRRLAQDLTSVGIAVESISGEGKNAVFEMEIGTNRPDAMNHYGVAREASVIYNLPLRPIDSKLPATPGKPDFSRRNRGQGRLRPLHLSHRSRCEYQAIARMRSRNDCCWSISAPSTTPPTPPTTRCGRWGIPRTFSISICWRAGRFWCGGRSAARP